jgi:hypothetical protein
MNRLREKAGRRERKDAEKIEQIKKGKRVYVSLMRSDVLNEQFLPRGRSFFEGLFFARLFVCGMQKETGKAVNESCEHQRPHCQPVPGRLFLEKHCNKSNGNGETNLFLIL